MKQAFILLIACMIGVVSVGQKQHEIPKDQTSYDQTYAQLYYWNHALSDARDTNAIKRFISREMRLSDRDELQVIAITQSITATHITLRQLYNGIEVFGGGAKVAVSRNNVLFRCLETLRPTGANMPSPMKEVRLSNKLSNYRNVHILSSKPVYVWDGDRILSAWYAHFLHDETGDMEKIWRTDGTLFLSNDLNRYYAGPDSIVSAKVFYPDPITPINKVYGGVYVDLNDGNSTILDPERKDVQMEVEFDNGTFRLKSDYVEIVEHSSPNLPVVTSSTPEFAYSRTDDGFEQTNAYYHIMNYQNYLQSLGFNNLDDFIHVDAQGFNGQDNSAFTPSTNPPRLTFGEGGVDDAEDSDVIIHEYGHHISNMAAPFTNNGIERRCLDEAFGDYLAVSYTKDLYSFGSNLVFNWDGHNAFWTGRTVDNPNDLCYDNVNFTNIYSNTTIFNAAMFSIWDQLGKTYTDKLMIEALHGYYLNMSFRDAAHLVIDADSALGGGGNEWLIWQAFDEHCILDWSDITESDGTLQRPYRIKNNIQRVGGTFQIELLLNNVQASIEAFDMTGKLIWTQILEKGNNDIHIQNARSGIYVVQIHAEQRTYAEKVLFSN